jgi:hypothetical protein
LNPQGRPTRGRVLPVENRSPSVKVPTNVRTIHLDILFEWNYFRNNHIDNYDDNNNDTTTDTNKMIDTIIITTTTMMTMKIMKTIMLKIMMVTINHMIIMI